MDCGLFPFHYCCRLIDSKSNHMVVINVNSSSETVFLTRKLRRYTFILPWLWECKIFFTLLLIFLFYFMYCQKTKMYSGGICTTWGEVMEIWVTPERVEQPNFILLQVKPDHIPNRCPAKFAFRLPRGSKWAKSAIFAIFFGFSNIPAEHSILEENFCLLKFRSHRDASFPRQCMGSGYKSIPKNIFEKAWQT